MRELLLLDIPHRQVVITIPKRLPLFVNYKRRLLGDLYRRALRLAEKEPKPVPSKGRAEMIRKVFKAGPMVCPKCGGTMKIIVFITEYAVADRVIEHLKLKFAATKPPPSHVFEQVALMAAEESGEYF